MLSNISIEFSFKANDTALKCARPLNTLKKQISTVIINGYVKRPDKWRRNIIITQTKNLKKKKVLISNVHSYFTDMDTCQNNQCMNAATCVNNEGWFTCTCVYGWDGFLCDQGISLSIYLMFYLSVYLCMYQSIFILYLKMLYHSFT